MTQAPAQPALNAHALAARHHGALAVASQVRGESEYRCWKESPGRADVDRKRRDVTGAEEVHYKAQARDTARLERRQQSQQRADHEGNEERV